MRALSIFLLMLPFVFGCSTTTPVKMVGYVQSSKTDENDNPVSIFLWDGKAAYPIDENDKMEELLEKVDSKIEADGDLNESYSGEKTVLIKKYRVVKDAFE